MFDGPLMLLVNLPVIDTINILSNKFVTGVKIKVIGESKFNDSSENKAHLQVFPHQILVLTSIFVVFFLKGLIILLGWLQKRAILEMFTIGVR